MSRLLALVLILVLVPAAWLLAPARAASSEAAAQQTRDVPECSADAVSAGLHANASIGARAPLTLRGEESVLSLVATEVKDGRLEIGWKRSSGLFHKHSGTVEVTVRAPQIVALRASGGASIKAALAPSDRLRLEASGGGSIDATGLAIKELDAEASAGELDLRGVSGARLNVSASGGATVEAEGKVQEVTLRYSGGGNLKAHKLTAANVTVNGSGGAEGAIGVTGKVTGHLSGGSSLQVPAGATVEVSTSGGSEVVRK